MALLAMFCAFSASSRAFFTFSADSFTFAASSLETETKQKVRREGRK